MKGTQRRAAAIAVAITMLATAVAGCSNDERAEKQSEQRTGSTAEVVAGRVTTVVSPSGAVVTIPADGATGGTLAIAETSPPDAPPEAPSTREPGLAVDVTLTGGELTGDATIEFPLEAATTEALPLIERYDEAAGTWRPLPLDDIEIGDLSVSVQTPHFSWYRPSWLSVDRMAEFVRDRWFDVFGDGLAGAQQPTCPRDAETLARFTWTSSPDDTLFWCVGTNDDGAVITNVVNNNRYPVALDVSDNMTQLGKFGGSWSAEALGAAFDEWGSGQVVLEPREGVTFLLTDGTDGRYELASDFTLLTWSIGMLGVALTAYADVWTRSGTDLDTVQEKLAYSLSATSCVAELGPKLLSDPGLWTATRTLLVEMFGCGGDVIKEALASEGWWTQRLASVVGFITGPVISAFVGLVALAEVSVDSLARRATYDLSLTPKPRPAPTPAPVPTAAPRTSAEQVAIEFVRAIMTGGDPSPWAESPAVVEEGRAEIWTADDPSIVSVSLVGGDCAPSHVVTICTVGGEALDEFGNGASAWDVYVRFAEPRPGAAPNDYDDVIPLDRPVVVDAIGVAG